MNMKEYIINYADGSSNTVCLRKWTRWPYLRKKKVKNIIERSWKYCVKSDGLSMDWRSTDKLIRGKL